MRILNAPWLDRQTRRARARAMTFHSTATARAGLTSVALARKRCWRLQDILLEKKSNTAVAVDEQTKEPTFFSYMAVSGHDVVHNIQEVHVTSLADFKGYVVLDTACQRSCASSTWASNHTQLLGKWRMKPMMVDSSDDFQFGAGEMQRSHQRAYLAAGIGQQCLALGASVLENSSIPYLGSLRMMEKLGCVIDMPSHTIWLTAFGISVPLVNINGHVGMNICDYPEETHERWKALSDESIWKTPDPEVVFLPQHKPAEVSIADLPDAHSSRTSELVDSMAADRDDGAQGGDDVAFSNGQQGNKGAESRMRSPGVSTLRQQVRQVQQVPSVRDSVPLVRRSSRLGSVRTNLFTKLCLVAAAFAGINHTLSDYRQGCEFHGFSNGQDQGEDEIFTGQFGEYLKRFNDEAAGSGRGGRDPSGQFRDGQWRAYGGHGERGERGVPMGVRKRLKGEWSSISRVYQAELAGLQERQEHGRFKTDLLELYAGEGKLTREAHHYNLTTTEPLDIKSGTDLGSDEGMALVDYLMKEMTPMCIAAGYTCTNWSLFNENMNFHHRLHVLEEKRDEERPRLRKLCSWMDETAERGGFYILENPQKSRLWEEECMQELINKHNGFIKDIDGGAYGQSNQEGDPVRKTFRFVTNSKHVANLLDKRLTAEEKNMCVPIQGRETKESQVYPDSLIHAILQGIQAEAKEYNKIRFNSKVHMVHYARPVSEVERWAPILADVERVFEGNSYKTVDVTESDEIYQKVVELVPWKLTKIQVVKMPLVRRFPIHFPYTHRGCALETTMARRNHMEIQHYQFQIWVRTSRSRIVQLVLTNQSGGQSRGFTSISDTPNVTRCSAC